MNIEELPSDPYASLGVANNASSADIKAAYRKLALKYHPDKCSDDAQKEINTNEFHKIQKAYDIIGNEDERSRYDARIRLSDLLKQRDALRSAARPSASRSATVYPAQQSFPIREIRVEERKPKSYDDSDADYLRTTYTSRTEYESVRRPTATRIRSERARDSEQRRRSDRARERDTDRRDSRTAKYEFDEPSFVPDLDERVRPRAADDIKLKYGGLEEGVYRYRSKVSPEQTRPSPPMRSSTRGKYHEPRRSQASRDRDAEILGRERDRLLESIHRENGLFGEVRHQERDPHQRMQNRSRENTEQYDSHSAPFFPGRSSRYARSQTDPLSPSQPGPPPMNRSSTTPQVRRRDVYVSQRSKPRDGAAMGDSESSSSSTSDRHQHKSTPAQPVRATERVHRVRPDSVEEPPRMSYRIVEPTSSRGKKHSSGTRSAYAADVRPSPPMRATRSPEPLSPLERSRDRDYVQSGESYYERKPLYAERGASYPVGRGEYRSRGVTYSKRLGPDDIRYSSFRRRESDYMDRPIPSRLSRSSTMPLPA